MKIRPESKQEYDSICRLVQTAFKTARVSGGTEADMVKNIRGSEKYVPELALVAEMDGKLIGYIMLSETTVSNGINTAVALNLGPVCSLVEHRNKGIGGELIKSAILKAKEMGYASVFLAGDCKYYNRFGFVPASKYGIKCQLDVPEELLDCIMALELVPGALNGMTSVILST